MWITKPDFFMFCWLCILVQSCKQIQKGAQFRSVYLFLFSTCFGQPCAHHQEKLLYLCYPGICHSVWVVSGLLVGVSFQPADQTPPIQSDKYQCSIDKFSWWWARGCPKHVEKRNKYTKQNFAPSWIYLQDYKTRYVFIV